MSEVKEAVSKARDVKLGPTRFQADEFARMTWCARPESTVTPEQVLNPMFWSHVAGRLKPYSEIVIIPEGGAFYLRVLVTGVTKVDAVVVPLEFKDLRGGNAAAPAAPTMPSQLEDYELKYINASVKWRVLRKADKQVLQDGLENEKSASDWLKNHLKVK